MLGLNSISFTHFYSTAMQLAFYLKRHWASAIEWREALRASARGLSAYLEDESLRRNQEEISGPRRAFYRPTNCWYTVRPALNFETRRAVQACAQTAPHYAGVGNSGATPSPQRAHISTQGTGLSAASNRWGAAFFRRAANAWRQLDAAECFPGQGVIGCIAFSLIAGRDLALFR